MQGMNKKYRLLTIIIFILLLFVAGFIFFMSSRDVDQSLGDSMTISCMMAYVLVDDFEDMSPEEQYQVLLDYDEPLRHVAHTLEFFALGSLMALACLLLRRLIWLALIAGVGYGVLDEVHQIFVNGRGCQLSDMCFDTLGVLLSAGVIWLEIARAKKKGWKGPG